MPSFLAHSATSIALAAVYPPKGERLPGKRRLVFLSFFALLVGNLPDLDFIPQLLTGERFHHGPTHSILFTVSFGAVIYAMARIRFRRQAFRLALSSALLVAGHMALDMLSTGGPGVQLLWPFSAAYIKAPITFFPPVNFNQGLWDPSHLTFLAFELGYLALLAVALWGLYRRKAPVRTFDSVAGGREDHVTHG